MEMDEDAIHMLSGNDERVKTLVWNYNNVTEEFISKAILENVPPDTGLAIIALALRIVLESHIASMHNLGVGIEMIVVEDEDAKDN